MPCWTRRIAHLLLVGATLSVAAPAAAEDEPATEAPLAYDREGGYVGAGGQYGFQDFDTGRRHGDGWGLLFRGGYRGERYFGVEFLGEVLEGFEVEKRGDRGGVDGFAVTVNGKAYLPLGRAEPFAAAGVGFLDVDPPNESRKEDFAFRFAAGMDVYLTPHWALSPEAAYVLPTGHVSGYRYWTLGAGLLYRF